ncbi:MAG: TMEM14 family protein [Cyanobacteriota bacterium]
MNLGTIAAIAYGILAVVGGIMGYSQAQSKVSLISGSISGLLLILGGVMLLQGQVWGLILATVVTAVLVIVFAIRLAKTRKFMPAGLMSLLGLITLAVMIQQLVAIV